jgi:hypothetical protein
VTTQVQAIPHKYGLKFPFQLNDLQLEMYCFKVDHPSEKGGLGKYRHFMNISRMVLPEVKFHEWSRTQIRSLCQTEHAIKIGNVIQRFVYWPGCKSAGKTFTAGHYAFLWWLCDMENSAVMLTSTSGVMVKRRIWPVIQDLYHMAKQSAAEKFKIDEARVNCGNLLDSQTILQREKGDFKRAISALSVEQGELGKTVAKIQGQHAKRIMLIVDEATDTPEAIFKAIPNMEGGCSDLTVLLIGNPISRELDPFDRACQPVGGWDSISIDALEWPAKGEEKDLCLKPGLTVNFQGWDSPNVKAGKTIFSFLYSYENHLMDRGKEDTIEYWKWTRGRPPPAGISNTVMDEVMIRKYDGRGKHTFLSRATPIAALDPAFGGDGCVLQFGLLGDLTMTKLAVQCTEMLEFKPLATTEHEIDWQIAQWVIAECKKRGVAPQFFGSDGTGIGKGVYSHLREDWGECIKVEFGGMASDKPASEEDPRPSFEVYDRRVTELWYSCKELLKAGQLKGLYTEAVRGFCFRTYTLKNRKTEIQTKDEMKLKFGRSPDHADAVSILCEVARQRGLAPARKLAFEPEANNNFVKAQDEVYDEDTRFNNQFELQEEIFSDW